MITKRCNDCLEIKPTTEFYASNGKYFSYCKQCKSIKDRAKYAAKKGAPVRKRYPHNTPRPCVRCSPDTVLPLDRFYTGAKCHRTICKECLRFKAKLRYCGVTINQVNT